MSLLASSEVRDVIGLFVGIKALLHSKVETLKQAVI